MSKSEDRRQEEIRKIATAITAPVREIVETQDEEGYEKWFNAVVERLILEFE